MAVPEQLCDPAEHRPLEGAPWSEAAARDAIAEIAADATAAYRGPEAVWPNHPADFDDEDAEADRPYRSVYLGAAGMAWALARLAADGLCDPFHGAAELGDRLHRDYLDSPELLDLETGTPPPPPSLLFGESGILLALEGLETVDALRGSGSGSAGGSERDGRRDALAARIAANARNPTREACWGSPGTMIAAEAMWRSTGEERWRELWRDSAAWLCDEQEDDGLWTQDMYGQTMRFVGAGHGFAGNAAALLAGADLFAPGPRDAAALAGRVAATAAALAQRDGPFAQWPARHDAATERRPVQWCHGSPGIVTSLARLPANPEIEPLLTAGGELTWQAGPLRKGVGLCHGTAGNAFALLALHRRGGDERWLERARAFAMDAAADVRAWRERHGRGRYTLFTGDIGVALLLRACLDGTAAFPFLDDALA